MESKKSISNRKILVQPVNMARRAHASYRNLRERENRRVPALRVEGTSSTPTIYYLAPCENKPSGGVKVIYQHVEILSSIGFQSAVFHPKDGFRCDWFPSQARVVTPRTIKFAANDILVIPEFYGRSMPKIDDKVRKVVLNQAAHRTFDGMPLTSTRSNAGYFGLNNLEGLLCISEDNVELLNYAFPTIKKTLIRNVVDPRVFRQRSKKAEKIISFVPSRRHDELHQILHILQAPGGQIAKGDWKLRELSGLSEEDMGDALRESAIFMSLSDRDGFGLPPAEAMATGCFVIGYPGAGGNEFFDPAYCSPVADTTQMIRALHHGMATDPAKLAELGRAASSRILGYYTTEGLKSDLKRFYDDLI